MPDMALRSTAPVPPAPAVFPSWSRVSRWPGRSDIVDDRCRGKRVELERGQIFGFADSACEICRLHEVVDASVVAGIEFNHLEHKSVEQCVLL